MNETPFFILSKTAADLFIKADKKSKHQGTTSLVRPAIALGRSEVEGCTGREWTDDDLTALLLDKDSSC